MIPVANIEDIFDTLATYLNAPIYQAYPVQETESEFPHGVYNIIMDQNEHAYQNVLMRTENIDPTLVDNNFYEKTKLTISLIFCDKNRIDRIALLAQNALHWFKSTIGREYCKAQGGIIVNLINNNIQDRTIWIEHLNWENRYGFDLQFLYVNKMTEPIEDIEIIKLDPYPENIAEQEIIINV